MNKLGSLKNKGRLSILFFALSLICITSLIYLYEGFYQSNQALIDKQSNNKLLISSIGLMQVSQTLNGLDKQRSLSVFTHEYSQILQKYQAIQADLSRFDSGRETHPQYAKQVADIIELLETFNDVAKVRNDYNYRKNNLRVIVDNGIDLNTNNERLYLWNLLKTAIEAKNLLTLGELYRDFIHVAELVENDKGAETKKIKNISFGSLNVFSTTEKVISLNVILNRHLEEIINKTDSLSDGIVIDSSNEFRVDDFKSTRLIYYIFIISLVIFSLYFLLLSLLLIKKNKHILLSLSEVADLKSFDSIGSSSSFLDDKDLLFYSKIIPFIVREKNPSFILLDKNDAPLYLSKIFYEQNKPALLSAQTSNNQNKLTYSLQDNHYFLSFAQSQKNEALEAEVIQPVLMVEVVSAQRLGSSEFKLLFIKSEMDEQDKQSKRLDSLAIITGAVAHDINNMISVIVSSLGILRESKSLNLSEDAKVIDRALFSADKSISLIDRLLTFSRCKKLAPELVEINELLEGLYEVIGFATDEKVKIELALTDKPLYTYIDPGQLETSIINLCINSSNAIQEKGFIKISTEVNAADKLTIRVEDNGHGIPKNIQGRIFEPFFTGRKKGEGHGLGLSMVYGFVKQSGGSIDLESRVGKGTVISISFSLKQI